MELLELYLAILMKIFSDLVTACLKTTNSKKKQHREKIVKIVLVSQLEVARNYSIMREFIFNTVYGFCKKTYENNIDVFKPVAGFLVNFICEFATSLEDRHFKLTLDICY
jgi:hypothetical protein